MARLASGVQNIWSRQRGPGGEAAGFRLVQAGFHFRAALMGIRMAEAAGTSAGDQLKDILGEHEDQLLAFFGAKDAITGLVSTLDLAAAAVFRLNYGPRDPADPDREHDLESFPRDPQLPSQLPSQERAWLNSVKGVSQMHRLATLRDMFTHRYFPRDLTIGAVFDHQVDIDGRPERFGDLLLEFRGFVVDRLVALSRMY
jgi:hypothetical protein